ncbi:MAG: DUF2193 domain-containing protein [Thermoprotei archaeon]|nr:MAG: DUF2193 domain-containing protein [Thermoprotei archaeon]
MIISCIKFLGETMSTRPPEFFEKAVREAVESLGAVVKINKEKRGQKFKITDAEPFVEAVKKMKPFDGQSPEIIALHVDSVVAHYEILKDLTDYIRPEDDPFVEHYQTPAILEILYDEDPSFRESMEKFVKAIEENEALIGQYVIKAYGGFWGPTCVVDFAFVPGSTSNIVNQILKKVDIPGDHKKAILAAKSWGMNTSYGIGAAFREALNAGKTATEAVKAEIEQLKKIYLEPTAAQAELMDKHGHTSFDVREYMKRYKERMKGTVKKAIDAGVHYGNIVVVPAYCVGDIGHHIAQSSYNMFKDDVVFAIVEACYEVLKTTLESAVAKKLLKNEWHLLRVATGSLAAALEYILELDAFTAPMIIDLLYKRFWSYNNKYPNRGVAAELHNVDFMDTIFRGWRLLWDTYPHGTPPKVGGVPVDLTPITKNEIIMNPQRYTYPGCAITVRTSALLRLADFPCFVTSETVTATLSTNAVAFNPKMVFSPARVRKNCAITSLMPARCTECQWFRAV